MRFTLHEIRFTFIPTTTFAPYVLGTEILTVEARISVSDANSSTHQYETYIGMLDNIGAGADGVTVGSTWNGSADVWFIRRAVAGTVYTTNASSGPTAGTWHHLLVTMTTTNIELFVDGVSVATATTNIPTAGARPMLGIAKNAGSGVNRTLSVDFIHFYRDYSTGRW